MAEFRLETERLVLRCWRGDDRTPFAAIINTPAMMRYFGGLMTGPECDAFLTKRMEDQRRFGMSYWAVTLRASGELVGTCGLRVADNYPAELPITGMVEVGWRIGEPWWRQGLASEAAKASLDWGWANLTVDEIGAWTTRANLPSQGVMAKLGMERRPDLDFDHPNINEASELRRHLVFSLRRPQ